MAQKNAGKIDFMSDYQTEKEKKLKKEILNSQQESAKSKLQTSKNTAPKTDSDIIQEYESIPEYNILQRGFSGNTTRGTGRAKTTEASAYEKKQSLYTEYRQAKNRQIGKFLSENGIDDDALDNAFANKRTTLNTSVNSKLSIPVGETSGYLSLKEIADKSGFSMDELEDYYNAKKSGEFVDNAVDFSDKHGVLGTGTSIATNLLGTATTVPTETVNYLTGKPIGSNEEVNNYGRVTGEMRGTVKNNISDRIENPTLDKLANFGYDVGTSIADMVAALAIGGQAGALPIMATSSGSNTLNEAKSRNLTPDQMIGTAVASGAIEALTEKLPLDNLFKIAKTQGKQSVKQLMKNVLKQAGTEASEEAISELANSFVDTVVNGDESEWNQSVNMYMLYGMTQSQAENQTKKDLAGRALQSALAGAVSGGIMAGGAGVIANSKSDIITPEQFQANNEYIQKLQSINEGKNYLNSYNTHAEQKIPDMRDLSTFQNGVSSDSQNNADSDAYAYAKMLERVQAVPRNGFEQKISDDIKNSHPTGVDATNTPQPLRPEQSVWKATQAVNQSLDARAPQDTSENAAENTAFVKDSIPNSGENVNEGAQNVQYNGKKIDGFNDLNRDLDRLVGMYKGNETTQSLYEQMKAAVNEYVQTGEQEAIDRAVTLASDIDDSLIGHSYTRKGNGKNSAKSQNNRVTTTFSEGDFIDTLLSYTNEMRNKAKINSESAKHNKNVNTEPVRNTYVEKTAQFGDKVSKTRTNTIENSGLASEKELKNYHAPEKFTYEQISEENSINKATEKLNKYGQDYVNDILSSDNENISGVDIDALMMEYRRLTESARQNGSEADWNRAQDILKKIQVASTRNAQALQALAKWSRNTPEGQLAQANTAIEQTIEKKFGRKRTQKARETVEKVYEAAKSGDTAKIEYELDKLNIDKRSIKQLALELGSKSGNTAKADYALDKVNIDEKSINQSNLQVENNQKITRNTVIELLENEGKINKKLAESLMEDTALQRQVLDMLEQMYDVGVDTYAGQVIMARVGKLLSSKIQHTVGDKVRQILYNNMLGNFRTLISRNAGGNVAVATMEQARQPLAATIDRSVSHFTGKRTTTGWSKDKQLAYIEGFAKGLNEEFKDIGNTFSEYKNGQRTGLHTSKSGEYNLANAIKNNDSAFKGNNVLTKFINFKNDMVKHGLSLGDRPFYEATKNQAKVEIKQLLKQGYDIDTDALNLDEYIEQASSLIALEAVYQGDTELSKGFQEIRNGLSKATEGMIGVDIMSMPIVPFVKTPSNVLDMAIEYSPFGFIKNAVKTVVETRSGKEGFNQRRFVDETSRNIVGTLLMSACVLAYSAGKFTGGYDEDKDVKNAQKAAGMQEYALSYDDGKKNFDVGWVPVIGSAVEAGAAYGDARDNGSGVFGALGSAMGQTAQSVFDQSMLESLSNLLGNNSYKDENFLVNAGKSIAGSALGMIPPSLGRQIAQSTDKYERNLGTYGTNEYYINSFLNSIPGARQLLDIKYDNEGNPVLQNQGRGIGSKLLENMLLPGKVTDVNYSDLSKESIRLFESTGEKNQFVPTASQTDIKNDTFTPTTKEFNEYKRILGENNSVGAAALMDSDFYNSLDDSGKVKYISNIYSDMKQISKMESMPNYEYPDSYKKKMELYDEFGLDGLINYYYINKESENGGVNKKVSAIANLDVTDEEKGKYIEKLIDVSKAASEIQSTYGDSGLYTWYSLRSNADSDGNGNISNAEMISQIVQTDMPYEDMLNYASVLYQDGKEKTAREKASDAINDSQSLNRINSIISGRKSENSGNYQSSESSLERINEIINSRHNPDRVSTDDSLKRIQEIINKRNSNLLIPLN